MTQLLGAQDAAVGDGPAGQRAVRLSSSDLCPVPDTFSDVEARELMSQWTTQAAEGPPKIDERNDLTAMMGIFCTLKKRHRIALRSRFGFGNRDAQSLKELGLTLGGVSAERARQILAQALTVLRDRFVRLHRPKLLQRRSLDALIHRSLIAAARKRPARTGDLHRSLRPVTPSWPSTTAWTIQIHPDEIQRLEEVACQIRGGCFRPNDHQGCMWCGSPGKATRAA